MRIFPMLLALSMLPSAAHAQGSSAFGFRQPILETHNRERAAVGAPLLRWNMQLERDATAHAQQMARTGRFVHAPREGRGIARENLSRGPLGWGPDQLMRNWLSEKRYFHGGIYPNVCAAGWSRCAHYTQMIWPGTTDIGCGMASGGGFTWLVCRYSPGGNKDGKSMAAAVPRAPGGMKGPIDSAKSRQRLGTPGQAHKRSNLEVLCASSGKELRSISTRLEQLKARRAEIVAEINRVEAAIASAQAGLADYDPSLIEKLGTAQAPSNEKTAALNRRLAELQAETRSIQAETKGLLEKVQRIQAGSGICREAGEREQLEEERRPN